MDYFDRIVVINLRRRPDRLRILQKELAAWPFQSPDIFQAVDASQLPLPSNWQAGAGAWGCLKSHEQVLQQALEDGVERLLILEDDATLGPGFNQGMADFLARLPEDWDWLMLGGQHLLPPQPYAEGVVRCLNTHRTHAYAVREKMIAALYREFSSCAGHCDQIMSIMQPAFKVYAPDPFLFGQRASPSDVCGAWNPTNFWTGHRDPNGPLSRTQLLCFEIGKRCNFGGRHRKCPNMQPERFAGLNVSRELDDETIIASAVSAYRDHGFAGLVGWHYYCEPTLYGERMLRLMDKISDAVPEARFILWTNNSRPEWVAQQRDRFAWISFSNYMGDPDGLQLDDRLERKPARGNEPCMRPFTELILDCYGNHHPCCYDWRGEASLGNVLVVGFAPIVAGWSQFQDDVCGWEIVEKPSTETCRTCGRRPTCGVIDRSSAVRAMRWRQNLLLLKDREASKSA